jgi:hypothetical protein
MQITWMEFKSYNDVDVSFTRDTGTEMHGIVRIMQFFNRPAFIFHQDITLADDHNTSYVLTLPELKAIEQLINEALKHPDGPNAHTMKLFYEDTL